MKENKESQPEAKQPVTPMRIQQKEFRVSRFGGYKMRDVDEFLDEVTDALSDLMAEAQMLRSRSSDPAMVGTPDLGDVSRQADEIIRRARQEAAEIVDDARRKAAAATGPLGPEVAPADRAATAVFLANEKAFLQSLAGLVQGHAETVKGLVRSGREAQSAPSTSEPVIVGDITESEPESEPESGPESESEAAPSDANPEEPMKLPAAERRVVVDEPQHASVSPAEPKDEGSLRELFWGED